MVKKTLEERILLLQEEDEISFGKILSTFHGKFRPLILIVLSLPFCQPIQIPGLSVPFGLLISFFGFRMAFGKKAWLPQKMLVKTISKRKFLKFSNTALKIIKKIKPWIHPRFTQLCDTPYMKVINGLLICILGLFLALPLPIPFSNMFAAWSIFLISFGILESDGLLVLAGYIVSLLTAIFLSGMIYTIGHFLKSKHP